MAPQSPQCNGIISGINVTPLVDIMLVLLIVFMVTTTIVVTPAVPLDLPRASQTDEVQVIFSVVLPASDDQELQRHAREAFRRDAHVRAVINADGAVPHRRVIRALDLIKSAGIARVAFGALPPDQAVK